MGTPRFKETNDVYFGGHYEMTYREILGQFLDRGVVVRRNGSLRTPVKP
jgi:hypothetical protein